MWKETKTPKSYTQTFRGGRNPKGEPLGPAVYILSFHSHFELDHLKILYYHYFPLL